MSPLKNLHRNLYNRDNEDLVKREKSPDHYSIKEDSNDQKQERNSFSSTDSTKGKTENKNLPKKNDSDFGKKKSEEIKSKIDENQSIKNIQSHKSKFLAFFQNRIKIVAILMAVVFATIGGIVGYIKYKQSAFSQENVVIEFQGAERVKSGEKLKYKLLIHNNNRVALNNSKIKIIYPEELIPQKMDFIKENSQDSFYIEIGQLKSEEVKEYQLSFDVFASRADQVYLKSDLVYEPANFSSPFSKKDNHSFQIQGSIVDFSLIAQQQVTDGEVFKIVGVLTNNSTKDLKDLVLKMDYSGGFNLVESSMEKVGFLGDKFLIPKLASQEKKEVEILGNFNGMANLVKKIIGKAGILNSKNKFLTMSLTEESVKLIPSRITINQEIVKGTNGDDKTTALGKNLKYKVSFKNNSDKPLQDLVLKEEIKTDLIDHSSLRVQFGYYDQDKQEIVWKASDVPRLKHLNPGESGFVEFDFQLKDSFAVQGDNSNQTIATQAKISSLNIETSLLKNKEISSGYETIKVRTDLDILVSGDYESEVFKNDGPIPVKTGEETTFTVKVALKNNFNKIEKPTLTIKLPSGIVWKDSFHRSSGTVNFNNRTNILEWKMDYLDSQVGYKYPTEELIFQIGIKPQADQSGTDLILVKSAELQGMEKFIEKSITQKTFSAFKLNDVSGYKTF